MSQNDLVLSHSGLAGRLHPAPKEDQATTEGKRGEPSAILQDSNEEFPTATSTHPRRSVEKAEDKEVRLKGQRKSPGARPVAAQHSVGSTHPRSSVEEAEDEEGRRARPAPSSLDYEADAEVVEVAPDAASSIDEEPEGAIHHLLQEADGPMGATPTLGLGAGRGVRGHAADDDDDHDDENRAHEDRVLSELDAVAAALHAAAQAAQAAAAAAAAADVQHDADDEDEIMGDRSRHDDDDDDDDDEEKSKQYFFQWGSCARQKSKR